MVQAVELSLYRERTLTPFGQTYPAMMEISMAQDIGNNTKIPVSWFFGFFAFVLVVASSIVAYSILYITDIKLKGEINSVRITNLEANQQQSLADIKAAMTEQKNEFKALTERFDAILNSKADNK